MDHLQGKLYKLLVEIDEICKKNDVVYYLAGGTALGAIRGGGFLPWDDDIDLYITRDNWNKLVKIMETETPDNRVFVCNENTDLYWNPVGRYVDKNTTVMMKSQLLCGKACGQLIEFFVMDPMPIEEEKKWEHRKNLKVYAELLSPYFVVNRNILSENLDFDYKLYNKYYWKSKFFGRDRVLKELFDKITSVEEENSDCYCMRWGTRTLIYGKELLGEPRLEKFEEKMFPVPAKQEEVARIAYGDSWMYVPEGSGKVVHGLDKDLDTPFQKYVDLYMPLLNKEKLLRSYKKNKRIRTKALYNKNLHKKTFAIAKAKVAAKYIQENDYDLQFLEKLLEEKKFEELNEHFRYFYSIQSNSELKNAEILIPLSDQYLYIAIMCYVLQGAYYRANFVMECRKKLQKDLSKELKEADKIMQFCKKLSVAMYDKKDIQFVKKVLEEYKEYSEYIVDYARGELWVLEKEITENDSYTALVNMAREKMISFGNDGEIIRYEAYGLYCLGNVEEAKSRYEAAIERTRNGFVWREAMELFGIDAYDLLDNQHENDDEKEDSEEEGNEDDNSRDEDDE